MSNASNEAPAHGGPTGALVLGAIGVVYGDIGTSPLYALKECLSPHYGLAADRATLFGLLSLMFWSLTMVVTVKYLAFVMRAHNRGEGGILALLALCPESLRASRPGRLTGVVALAAVGAALLYGDGMITPAISVLSAVEGLEVAAPGLGPAVVPLTCVILLALFAIQRRGSERVGRLFGPIMLVWFGTLGGLGIWHIAHNPAVLAALSPVHAVQFLGSHGMKGFAVLGSVVLCITGGEALYADMGHFGARPIRLAWLGVVMPALVLAYFGQGAHILANPAATHNPFFSLVASGPFTYVLVALATAATVIASQALISGAYSLTHQAVQLGLFPRVTVQHTSADAAGQIYIPEINWFLALACIGLVLLFQSSGELAAAYGIAVCGTMAITSILYFLVAHHNWQWPLHRSLPLLALFLTFDLGFLGANLLKFHDGGYVPLVIGFGLFLVMAVWYVGRSHLAAYMARRSPSWQDFGRHLIAERILRPSGVGVFMASGRAGVPPMMVHQAERIGVLPQTALLLTIEFQRVPHVPEQERLLELEGLGHGFTRVVARYGFMDEPDVPRLIGAVLRRLGVQVPPGDITYYLGRETFVAGQRGRMGTLSESFFQFLSRNARSATIYFHLPPEQVVELGVQIDL